MLRPRGCPATRAAPLTRPARAALINHQHACRRSAAPQLAARALPRQPPGPSGPPQPFRGPPTTQGALPAPATQGEGASGSGVVLSFEAAVKDKEVISCAEGTKLGRAEAIVADGSAMTLEAITLTQAGRPGELCVPMLDVAQVGDVVLVSQAGALQRTPQVRDLVRLLDLSVCSASGVPIGAVRDVDFDPENGFISTVYFDEFGYKLLPVGVVSLFAVPVEAIIQVTQQYVTIDERFVWTATPGGLDPVGRALQGLLGLGSVDKQPAALLPPGKDARTLEWEARYGMTVEEWAELYGNGPRQQGPGRPPERPQAGRPDPRRSPYAAAERRRPQTEGAGRGAAGADPRDQGVDAGGWEREAANGAGAPWEEGGRRGGSVAAGGGGERPVFNDVVVRDRRQPELDPVQAPLRWQQRGDSAESPPR